MDLIQVNYSENSVNAKDVYDFVFEGQEKKTPFHKWISRAISRFDFEEGKDFQPFLSISSGGRRPIDYVVTIEMAKELSMVYPTPNSKKARKYFLKCEKIAKEVYATRKIGIELRKTLTDKIKESNENERMKGYAYPTYTKLAYKLCGIEYSKDKDFRDNLNKVQLKRVQIAEKMISTLLEMGKEYTEIKDTLSPIFKSTSYINE